MAVGAATAPPWIPNRSRAAHSPEPISRPCSPRSNPLPAAAPVTTHKTCYNSAPHAAGSKTSKPTMTNTDDTKPLPSPVGPCTTSRCPARPASDVAVVLNLSIQRLPSPTGCGTPTPVLRRSLPCPSPCRTEDLPRSSAHAAAPLQRALRPALSRTTVGASPAP